MTTLQETLKELMSAEKNKSTETELNPIQQTLSDLMRAC